MSDADRRYDLVVVGLGAMGASVLYQAAARGLDVVGIDRYDPPHDLGSTNAETRITRLAVGEGPQYLPLAARSHHIWRRLEDLTGEQLLFESGGLIVTEPAMGTIDRWNDFAAVSADIAATAGLPFELLDGPAARSRYPMLRFGDGARIGLEPNGGVVLPERAVEIQLRLARELGAEIRSYERVVEVSPAADRVTVSTEAGRYLADNVVLAAGPWLPELTVPAHAEQLRVTRQTVFWFEVDDLDVWSTDCFPFVIWPGGTNEDYLALFPRPPGGTPGLKVLGEQFVEATTPDAVDRNVTADEVAEFYETLAAPRIDGIRPTVLRTAVCLYTNTPDDHFLIDRDPRSERILVMSPCSGHGFKHSPALGEAVVELVADGATTLDLTAFRSRS